jgi:raffinose/stachyose/melibiose transport system substrate-binding protein
VRKLTASFAISCGVVLALFLSGGCFRDSPEESRIVIFQSKTEITTQLEEAARAYQREKNVEVEVWIATGDDYFHQIRTRIVNNQGPTLFSLGFGPEVAQMADYLENLGDLPFVKDIPGPLLAKTGGKAVGIPYTVQGFGIVYNKSLINPSELRDYDSFVKMLQDMKARGINGFGLSQESYFLIGQILNAPFAAIPDMEQYMDRLAKGQVKMIETSQFQEFAHFYAAIRDNSYNPLEVNYEKECEDFAAGKTAAIHQGNWAYGMLAGYKMNFEMGLLPFPLRGNDKLAVGVPAVWVINNQAPEVQRIQAKDFLTWLYTSETGRRFMTGEFGFIPVVKGMTSPNLDPLSAEVSRYVMEGKTIPWATIFYPPGIVDVYLAPAARQFFTSKQSTQEFLTALDKAWAKAHGR